MERLSKGEGESRGREWGNGSMEENEEKERGGRD